MGAVQRVLDANVNRAAEGMRVLEDVARFVLDREDLCAAIKQCRHDLRHSLPAMVWSRDVQGDVGMCVSTEHETSRQSVSDIVIASSNRVAEALRVVEEFLKLQGTKNDVEQIRYRMYALSGTVLKGMGSSRKQQWKLCFVLTVDQCTLPWRETLGRAIDAGCDCVQIREKKMTTQMFVEHTEEVVSRASERGVSVIVNDRVDVACVVGASGVHLGQADMSIAHARHMCGNTMIIGATVHSKNEARSAMQEGADYLGIGSMFSSTTKPKLPPQGTRLFENILQIFPLSNHLAIGGITPRNAHQLYAVGCQGVAMSAAIATSTTPEHIVRDSLKGALQPSS